MKKGVFILMVGFVLYSCTKEKKVELRYGQTQCADKWAYGTNDSETILKMVDYFKARNVKLFSPELSAPPADFVTCLACTCSSGSAFTVLVNEDDADKLKAEGFY